MKVNISKPINPIDIRNPKLEKRLQKIENEFAEAHGIIPRTVVYAPFNFQDFYEMILDHMANQNYPLCGDPNISFEEFRRDIDKMYKNELVAGARQGAMSGGFFNKARSDKVYLLSNMIQDKLLLSKRVLFHETFHAGIYDLARGKIEKLVVYKNKNFNSEFMRNLITEHKMNFLVRNRSSQMLSRIVTPGDVYSYYSFEEEFVRYNTLCAIVEDMILGNQIDIPGIKSVLETHVEECGIKYKNANDNVLVELYGKRVSLKSYLPEYYKILRGPVDGYDETDQILVKAVEKYPTCNLCFEESDSRIPELVDELIEIVIKGKCSNSDMETIIRSFIKNVLNSYNV